MKKEKSEPHFEVNLYHGHIVVNPKGALPFLGTLLIVTLGIVACVAIIAI